MLGSLFLRVVGGEMCGQKMVKGWLCAAIPLYLIFTALMVLR